MLDVSGPVARQRALDHRRRNDGPLSRCAFALDRSRGQTRDPSGHRYRLQRLVDPACQPCRRPRSRVASAWRGLLADGSEAVLDVYEVVVDWDGHRHRVPADSADIDPLVGMSLLRGYRLRIDVMAGGNVTVEAI